MVFEGLSGRLGDGVSYLGMTRVRARAGQGH